MNFDGTGQTQLTAKPPLDEAQRGPEFIERPDATARRLCAETNQATRGRWPVCKQAPAGKRETFLH
jgi:hypothetical protein